MDGEWGWSAARSEAGENSVASSMAADTTNSAEPSGFAVRSSQTVAHHREGGLHLGQGGPVPAVPSEKTHISLHSVAANQHQSNHLQVRAKHTHVKELIFA